MRKILYSMLIAFGVSACVESDIKNPERSATLQDPVPANEMATLSDAEARQIAEIPKTPITQAEFDSLIANTPEGQPIVIKRRTGYALQIGQPYYPPVHPELLTFEFIECEFDEGIIVINTFQAIVNIKRCVMRTFRCETSGVVQQMEIRRSKIEELLTMEGGRVAGLTVLGTKIPRIVNDLGGQAGFQVIQFGKTP